MQRQIVKFLFPDKKIYKFIASILTLAIIMHIKFPHVAEVGDLLWGEDGSVFINEAYDLKWRSLVQPYAGYLHLYPRLWSLMIPEIGLSKAPILLLAGWVSAVAFTGYVLLKSLGNVGIGFYWSLLAGALIFLQPSTGEVYFTITNSQWFLGFALGVYLILGNEDLSIRKDLLALALLMLTGPFCILLLPVLVIKYLIYKDWRPKREWILLYAACFVLQASCFIGSTRVSDPINLDYRNWIEAIYIFFSMGQVKWYALIPFILWIAVFFSVIRGINRGKKNSAALGCLLILYGFIVYAAALWSVKGSPNSISPFSAGARYFWIPYATLITVILIVAANNSQRFFLLVLYAILCAILKNPPVLPRYATDFDGFVKYSKIKQLNIRINPFLEIYPDVWTVRGQVDTHNTLVYEQRELVPRDIIKVKGIVNVGNGHIALQDFDNDPSIVFGIPKMCDGFKYIGLMFDVERVNPSFSQVYWSSDVSIPFSEIKSRRRYYGGGHVEMNFVIKNDIPVRIIRFDPAEDSFTQDIQKTHLYCFGETRGST